MKKKILGLMLAVTMVVTFFAVAVNVIEGEDNMALIFSDDFDDNYLDPTNWVVGVYPGWARVEETNQRLEIDIEAIYGQNIRGDITLLRDLVGEGTFEVDLQNGFSWNYLYKFMHLWNEDNKYEVMLYFNDWGPISILIRTPEHPDWMVTYLYTGDTRNWNWLFHLKLIRNSGGTFTGIVTDDYGHYFEGTTSLMVPLDVPLTVAIGAWKWQFGYPVMIFFDNFRVFGMPDAYTHHLITTIESWNLPGGTENSLTPKLDGVIHLLNKGNENGAIHKLMDFINQVEALREKKLTNEQADCLTAEAQRIIDLIEG